MITLLLLLTVMHIFVEVPTIAGNEIAVDFGAKASASTEWDAQSENVRLNFSMAVTPEPVSSILFVTGGILLAGRGYLRRKKTA
jgi:hypothetical protein